MFRFAIPYKSSVKQESKYFQSFFCMQKLCVLPHTMSVHRRCEEARIVPVHLRQKACV